MRFFSRIIAAFMLSLVSVLAHADVIVKDAWVRATVPRQHATGAFMQIQSSADVRLISVKTTEAGVSELHEMHMENNVMRMREIPFLDIPANKTVELKPGGYHVMLMDLKGQAKAGESFPLTLTFEGKNKKRETIEIKAQILAMGAGKM